MVTVILTKMATETGIKIRILKTRKTILEIPILSLTEL